MLAGLRPYALPAMERKRIWKRRRGLPGRSSVEGEDPRPDRRRPDIGALARNPTTILGGLLAFLGLAALCFVLALQVLQVRSSPYVGIFAFFLLPVVLVAGLLLIPAGMAWEARRRAIAARLGKGIPPALQIDLGNTRHVRGIFFFSLSTAVILGVLGATGYRAVEFMDSARFCGDVCHRVMEPEYVPYKRSSHAEVPCTTCHIGPGADWYVQSKLSGIRQVFAVTLDTYPRPIPAPIEDLRPARDTCEDCHWRERAYGLRLRVYREYLPDEQNTLKVRALAFRVGTGGDEPRGVHWHTAAKVWYRAADEQRQTIGWVREETPEGTVEWTNPELEPDAELQETRLMDCIDCHNRAGHEIPSPEQLIDEALTSGELDRTLPYVKREALRLLSADDPDPDAAALAVKWQDGWFDQLRDFYWENYRNVALERPEAIEQAISELERISELVIYPDMNTTWRTYPNNKGHLGLVRNDPGCFRCHGTLVRADTGERLTGAVGESGCLKCHSTEAWEQQTQNVGHDLLPEMGCNYCHYSLPPAEIEESPGEPAPVGAVDAITFREPDDDLPPASGVHGDD